MSLNVRDAGWVADEAGAQLDTPTTAPDGLHGTDERGLPQQRAEGLDP